MSEIGLFEAMYSARAMRRLKPDPVPEHLVTRVLDAAIRAPSGGNAQNWIFIVVRDEEKRRQLGAIYRKASDEVSEIYAARGRPAHMTQAQYDRFMAAGAYLWDHLGDAPVILVPCLMARDMPRAAACLRLSRPVMTTISLIRRRFAAPASIPLSRTSSWPAARLASGR